MTVVGMKRRRRIRKCFYWVGEFAQELIFCSQLSDADLVLL